jgi:hypothetical protein
MDTSLGNHLFGLQQRIDVQRSAKDELVDFLGRKRSDILGPRDTLVEHALVGRFRLAMIRFHLQLNTPAIVPLDGPISIDEVARRLKPGLADTILQPDVSSLVLDEAEVYFPRVLKRLFRFSFAIDIFRETPDGSGSIEHTPLSREMIKIRSVLLVLTAPFNILSDLRLADARTLTGTSSAVEQVYGQDVWKVIASGVGGIDPNTFHSGLEALSGSVPSYPWKMLVDKQIIDVGGGQGQVATSLASTHPDLHIIVQDLEENAVGAAQQIPDNLKGRVVFQAHDFFHPQPALPQGPVIFFLKWVLHNWSDEDCVKILTHLLPGLKRPGSRLLVVEYILPDSSQHDRRDQQTTSLYNERFVRAIDLNMLTLFRARERTLMEFQEVFRSVSQDLEILKVYGDERSSLRLIEVACKNNGGEHGGEMHRVVEGTASFQP